MKVCLLSLTDLAKLLKNGVVEVTVDSEKIILMIKPREIVENVKFKKGGRRMNVITIPKEWKNSDLIIFRIK